uniref:Coiled-coil domain containing 152 n=1 Tax=Calidris pygmaea TaxID=425635 RepID=A0A8C3KJ07_9CHAR
MNHSHEESMKKISVVNLDKLLDNFSEIEKKISEINEANNLLVLQLEKCNKLLTLSQSKEESVKEGNFLHSQEYKDQIEKLMIEIKNKEEDHKLEITQLNCDIRKKLKEVEYREQAEKKELEILELTRQLKIQNEEKQNEIIKLQIEFNAKLARVQNKTTKSSSEASPLLAFLQKLQHLQEEKNKEIEILRNTIRDLEQRLNKGQDLHLKRRRF